MKRPWREVLNPLYVYRDSITGRFVTRLHARNNPMTTTRHRIWR